MYAKYEKLRDAKGMNDFTVAKEVGISSSTLSEWKTGKHSPEIKTLSALAKYFGVPVDYFISEDEG